MSTGAITVNWGAPVRGREAASLSVFGQSLEYLETLTKEGRIHGHKEYFSVTGKSGGFQLIEGELDELFKVLRGDEMRAILVRASAIVEDFEIEIFEGGDDASVQEGMTVWVNNLQELGYMST